MRGFSFGGIIFDRFKGRGIWTVLFPRVFLRSEIFRLTDSVRWRQPLKASVSVLVNGPADSTLSSDGGRGWCCLRFVFGSTRCREEPEIYSRRRYGAWNVQEPDSK